MATNNWSISYSDLSNTPASIPVYFNTIDNTTSLELVGQNAQGYGPAFNRNFLHLLENFASSTPPINPTTGQLWYDKSSSVFRYGQLKVHDGGTWGPTNGVWIQDQDPLITVGPNQRAPVLGEIWTETVGMQLKIFNGQSWALVGPATPANIDVQSGSFAEQIYAIDNSLHYVIKEYINGNIIAITAAESFTPTAAIPGFNILHPGINLSSILSGNSFNGISTAAASLVISGNNVPSGNFFRTDQDQIFNYNFTINNDSGIRIGSTLPTVHLSKNGTNVLLSNLIEGANIILSTTRNSLPDNVLIIDGTNRAVSILSTSTTPSATLDVTGSLKISSTATFMQSASVGGNVSINGNISVSGTSTFSASTFSASINSQSIVPITANVYNLGSSAKPFNAIYATSLNVNTSTIFSGTAALANRLTTATYFSIAGAICSAGPGVYFDGTQGSAGIVMNTVVTTSSIMLQTSTTTSLDTDYIAIANNTNLHKITKSDFLSSITPSLNPVGAIITFATASIPPGGWLLCNGASISVTTYANLFAVIGYRFGGSGSTCKVPNITDLATGIKYIIKY